MNLAPVTLRGRPSGPLPIRPTVSPCSCPGTTSLLRSQSGSQPQQEMRAGTIPKGRFGSASWLELDPLVLIIIPWTSRVNCTRWPASRWGNSGAGPCSAELRWKLQTACPRSQEQSSGSLCLPACLFSSESFEDDSQRCLEKWIPGVARGRYERAVRGHSQSTRRFLSISSL